MTEIAERTYSERQPDSGGSILFRDGRGLPPTIAEDADFYRDLNLDQLIARLAKQSEDYDLARFFRTPCRTITDVNDRQAVFRDLQRGNLLLDIHSFIEGMKGVRRSLARSKRQDTPRQKESWRLEATLDYCSVVSFLSEVFERAELESLALQKQREFYTGYRNSETFRRLDEDSQALKKDLTALRYEVLFTGLHVEVRAADSRPDYSQELAGLFERFHQGEEISFDFEAIDLGEMSWVEGEILERIALTQKEIFQRLGAFVQGNADFLSPRVLLFDEEIQFFTAYLAVIKPLLDTGLAFCYPRISMSDKHIDARNSFDLPLALQLHSEKTKPVTNDFELSGSERVLVVTGPNHGGKTTFARMFGQLHYLGSLGCLVPGSRTELPLADHILTHFEREESAGSEGGKLEDDVIRIHQILNQATDSSILIANEIFASTSLSDAIFLSKEIVNEITRLNAICVWVTFLEEIATLSPATVGYVSMVDPIDPVIRTFRILRRASDGQTYAAALAKLHHLSLEAILERVPS